MKPQLTVITCAYNGEDFIKESIDSVLAQSFSNFEYIIVDDVSTDGTAKIIDSYDDPRIILIQNKENLGTYKSANIALRQSKGKYIARLDADDLFLPKRLSTQYEFLENNPDYWLVGSQCEYIDSNGNGTTERDLPISFEENLAKLFFENTIVHSSVMFSRERIASIGNYSEKCRKTQDYELYLKVIANGGKVANLAQKLCVYRIHDGSMTVKSAKEQIDAYTEVLVGKYRQILNLNMDEKHIADVRKVLAYDAEDFKLSQKISILKNLKLAETKFYERFNQIENASEYFSKTINHIRSIMPANKLEKLLFRLY